VRDCFRDREILSDLNRNYVRSIDADDRRLSEQRSDADDDRTTIDRDPGDERATLYRTSSR
jgi:hypothetical protein